MKKEFTVKKEFYNKEFIGFRNEIEKSNSISLHVRRGDYVKVNGHHLLPLEYYKQALELVKGQLFVFSDEISLVSH